MISPSVRSRMNRERVARINEPPSEINTPGKIKPVNPTALEMRSLDERLQESA
jgi:hypothetical protein